MPNEWASMIKQEIIDIKIRMTSIEAQMKDLGLQSTPTTKDIYSRESIFDREGEWDEAHAKDHTSELVSATYTIKTTAIALRGYMMLLDQLGLSRDQKKVIREMEYVMMMAMKVVQAIRIMQTSQAIAELASGIFTWKGVLDLGIAGGNMAAGVAYGAKFGGSGI